MQRFTCISVSSPFHFHSSFFTFYPSSIQCHLLLHLMHVGLWLTISGTYTMHTDRAGRERWLCMCANRRLLHCVFNEKMTHSFSFVPVPHFSTFQTSNKQKWIPLTSCMESSSTQMGYV